MDYPKPKVIISLEEYEMLKEAKKSFDELSEEHDELKGKYEIIAEAHLKSIKR